MRYYRRLSSPHIIGVATKNTPENPALHCMYCGQPINYRCTPRVAEMCIDMGGGDLPLRIIVHIGCVNVKLEDGRDGNNLLPM